MLITGTFAYNESLQHQTIAVLLIKILIFFFFDHAVVFTCSKVINASKRGIREPKRFEKALNLIFPKLSLQTMRGFDHATILIPSFHVLRWECLAQ